MSGIEIVAEEGGWGIYGPPVRGRKCGACQACCVLVPVDLPEGKKPANVRCRHLRSKGCGIYANRPRPCQAWSCKWLIDDTTAALRRPDLSGYAIDPMLDTILAGDRPVEVIQVWCDPSRPDSHHDPALRDWLVAMHAKFGLVAIIRWGSRNGIILVPPAASESDEWLELGGNMNTEEQMRARLAKLGTRSVADMIRGDDEP